MHDPMTHICTVAIPLPFWRSRNGKREWKRLDLFNLWHVDPCRGPGGDDSCGWFKRAHHGKPKVLEAIIKDYEFVWDRIYTSSEKDHDSDDGLFQAKTYFLGLFYPQDQGAGMPNMSTHGIVLNLFSIALREHLKSDGLTNWKAQRKWMSKHLLDILMFAENPHDSLFTEIRRVFGSDCSRKERIRNLASIVYGWILRADQPWYAHPRWHIHHWRIQVPAYYRLHKVLFMRCSLCGRRFSWHESPVLENDKARHDSCGSSAASKGVI